MSWAPASQASDVTTSTSPIRTDDKPQTPTIKKSPEMGNGDDDKPPAWRAQEFAAAPTEDQLRALRAVEQQQQELKAKLGGQQRATIGEAVGTIKAEDFLSVHHAPCSRQGLLTGIGGGAGVGALRFVLGGTSAREQRPPELD